MKKPLAFLPGFKVTCLLVSGAYTLLAGGMFLRGLMDSMAAYQVPRALLDSPHYYDAIFWVYFHMLMIGFLIGGMGLLVREAKAQVWLSRLLCIVHVYYAILDIRSSDSPLGNALYKGPASIFPAIVGILVMLLFLHLSFGKESKAMSGS